MIGGGPSGPRQLELEQRILESRLREQQRQVEEDAKWLLKEETNLKKRLSITASLGSDDLTGSTDNVNAACTSRSSSGSSPKHGSLETQTQSQSKPVIVKVSFCFWILVSLRNIKRSFHES